MIKALTALTLASAGLVMAAPVGEIVTAGNFIHVIANLDQTIAFYRDVLGLQLNGPARTLAQPGPRPYTDNAFVAKLYGTPGAQSRVGALRLPDPAVALEFVEFKDIDQQTVKPRPQDPGASMVVLTVRSLDAALEKVHAAGTPIVTPGGKPVAEGKNKAIVVKDPDGFYIELVERDPASPEKAPAVPNQASGNVIGASLMISVADTEKTLHLYRDLIGIPAQPDAGFAADAALAKPLGVKGAKVRHSTGIVPGSNFQVDFVEWKGVDRKPAAIHIYDRGAGILRLRVKEIDPFVDNLKAAGVTVASSGGGPVEQNPMNHFCILNDPNSFFFQLAPAPRPRTQQTARPRAQ